MVEPLQHDLNLPRTRDEHSRDSFVSSLRSYILNDMANGMRAVYEANVLPRFEAEHGKKPENGRDVHRAIQSEDYFKFYSCLRYNVQEMVWRAVISPVERSLNRLNEKARKLSEDRTRARSSLELSPETDLPPNVSRLDVHLMPGNYHAERATEDCSAGAIYDSGLNVFAFGMMGRNLDDIGTTMSQYIKAKFPEFQPSAVLDVGCTVGHNAVPWKQTFPEADVHAVDVAAPVLRYAQARAQSLGETVHFHQGNAEALDFDDASFDVVFSSMFLHELSNRTLRKFFEEARRVLRPGGLLLNMELPPNNQMEAYDGFYLDWDAYYNNEPFYKSFRDQDNRELCLSAGFAQEDFIEFVSPRYTYMPREEYLEAIGEDIDIDSDTGRLSDTIQWYGFGAWKRG